VILIIIFGIMGEKVMTFFVEFWRKPRGIAPKFQRNFPIFPPIFPLFFFFFSSFSAGEFNSAEGGATGAKVAKVGDSA